MKVRAIEKGFIKGRRIKSGEVFEMPDGSKAKWFVAESDYISPEEPKEQFRAPKRGRRRVAEPASFREIAELDAESAS